MVREVAVLNPDSAQQIETWRRGGNFSLPLGAVIALDSTAYQPWFVSASGDIIAFIMRDPGTQAIVRCTVFMLEDNTRCFGSTLCGFTFDTRDNATLTSLNGAYRDITVRGAMLAARTNARRPMTMGATP